MTDRTPLGVPSTRQGAPAHDDPAPIPYPRRGLRPRRHRHAGCFRLLQVGGLGQQREQRQQPGSAGGQDPPESSSGSGCSLQSYGAPPKLDLKNAVVGFSQSEKEANPFRIAETQSIKDEAKKLGVKKLLTTNAQSQLPKQISDIQDMLAQAPSSSSSPR